VGTRISVLAGYTLTIFLLMVSSLLPLISRQVGKKIKSRLAIQIVLKKTSEEGTRLYLIEQLHKSGIFASVSYIPEKDGIKKLERELGTDFIKILGYNPVSPLVEVKPSPDYFATPTLDSMLNVLRENPIVQDINYPVRLVERMETNLRRISIIILALAIITGVISLALLRNIIVLDYMDKRFLIRTMTLVGASWWFIKKPFIGKSILTSFFASVISSGLLALLIYLLIENEPSFREYISPYDLAFVFTAIPLIAVLISIYVTDRVITSHIKKSPEELYRY